MKEKIINILEKDRDVERLIMEFKQDFAREYKKLNQEQREILMNYRDAAYRKWLYSPVIEDTYLTPSYIINDIAQKKIKGKYTIIPHIKILPKTKTKLDFQVRWIYYSKDESPIIEDIFKIVKHANPTIVVRPENIYLVDNGEELIDNINFRSAYYIELLIKIAVELGLLEQMKSIGCQCYQHSDQYNQFVEVTNEEKVNQILDATINICDDEIVNFFNLKDDESVIDFLDNNVTIDDFDYLIEEARKKVGLGYLDVSQLITSLGNRIDEQGLILFMAMNEAGVVIDSLFTTVFSYYLGIIQPVYSNYFVLEHFNYVFTKEGNDSEKLTMLFNLEDMHNLTSLGNELVKMVRNEISKPAFRELREGEAEQILARYVEEKTIIAKRVMKQVKEADNILLKQIFDEEEYDDDYDEFDNEIEELFKLPVKVKEHLEQFYIYLKTKRKLKEESCDKSYENIGFFIYNYLEFDNVDNIGGISESAVDNYLGEWFINKIATSKNSINEQISSLNQYFKFLELSGIIDSKRFNEIKNVLKNKEKYYDLFEKCMAEDYCDPWDDDDFLF